MRKLYLAGGVGWKKGGINGMCLAEKICMDLQGKGIGSIVIEGLKIQTSALEKPIR